MSARYNTRRVVPSHLRCTAIVTTAGGRYNARCEKGRISGGDLCPGHLAHQASGHQVRRIQGAEAKA